MHSFALFPPNPKAMLMCTPYIPALLLALIIILCGVYVHGQHTYWIAPDVTQCRDERHCQTLENYTRHNASLFSTSHTKWIFLQGEHHLKDNIEITSAVNVTLTGEHSCWRYTRELCSTIIVHKIISTVASNKHLESVYRVHVENTTNFTLSQINISYDSDPVVTDKIVYVYKSKIGLEYVYNIHMHSVFVHNMSLSMLYPMGTILMQEFHTNANLSIYIVNRTSETQDAMSNVDSSHTGQIIATLNLSDSSFMSSSKNTLELDIVFQWFGTVNVENCKFTNSRIELGSLFFNNYYPYPTKRECYNISSCSVIVNIINCTFSHIRSQIGVLWLSLFMLSESNKVTITNCRFTGNDVKDVIFMRVSQPTSVVLENVLFHNNYNFLKDHGSVIWMENHAASENMTLPESQFTLAVKISNCRFVHNWLARIIGYRKADLSEPISHLPALYLNFQGQNLFQRCQILHVMDLEDTLISLEENSTVVIKETMPTIDTPLNQVHVLIKMSPASLILLHNNSELMMVNNDDDIINLFIDNPVTQEQFVRCYVYKEGGCDGGCIFQFVDENGMYVTESDLDYFNASIVMSRKSSKKAISKQQPLIYNAHLQNCTLRLRTGNKIMEERDKQKHLKLDSWDETTIGSPCYYICMCDQNEPQKKDCFTEILNKNTGFFTLLYPGITVSLSFVVLGDYGIQKEASYSLKFHRNNAPGSRVRNIHSFGSCANLASFQISMPESDRSLITKIDIISPFSKSRYVDLHGFITIQVNDCPTGFTLYTTPRNACNCTQILLNHHFQCTITISKLQARITYKPPSGSYWMGYLEGQMVFTNNCPYCNTFNSTLSTTGITPEDINTTKQCDSGSNRQGLICSQCTPGMSSQFGSFHCAECTFVGLLLVPSAAIAGILLIVILFLFNFTVLQGDIVGIAFYANVVGIMDDFLLKYSLRPFYVLLTLINLGLGFETCFFNGMDEFAKAIVQFVFPFYLFSLLIIIIIAAHKYNLKIFHVRFVARRSVPVLATIMLLTFSGLINAVIYGLQYTTIYNVDLDNHKLVWLHQPELEYFKGKHIAIGVLCLLVLLFYLLPLTIVTLFGDLFRIRSRNLWFSHFLDVFHGAFQYPFGFWFGTKLLLRIIFIVLNITTNTHVVAYTIFLVTASILLLQLCLEPFRTDNVIIYRPDPERKITRKDMLKAKISKIFRPKIIDSLYLFNIVFIIVAVAMSNDISTTYTTVGVCLSISLALAQLVAVTVHHAYHYFPLPDRTPQRMEALRERFIDFKARMRERRIARRNQREPPDTTPVQITYLSASMCFNSEEYSSSSSSEEERGCEGNEDKNHDQRETSL